MLIIAWCIEEGRFGELVLEKDGYFWEIRRRREIIDADLVRIGAVYGGCVGVVVICCEGGRM